MTTTQGVLVFSIQVSTGSNRLQASGTRRSQPTFLAFTQNTSDGALFMLFSEQPGLVFILCYVDAIQIAAMKLRRVHNKCNSVQVSWEGSRRVPILSATLNPAKLPREEQFQASAAYRQADRAIPSPGLMASCIPNDSHCVRRPTRSDNHRCSSNFAVQVDHGSPAPHCYQHEARHRVGNLRLAWKNRSAYMQQLCLAERCFVVPQWHCLLLPPFRRLQMCIN